MIQSLPEDEFHLKVVFFCLYLDGKFIILHGFRKQSMKTPEKEIATALHRMKEITEK